MVNPINDIKYNLEEPKEIQPYLTSRQRFVLRVGIGIMVVAIIILGSMCFFVF